MIASVIASVVAAAAPSALGACSQKAIEDRPWDGGDDEPSAGMGAVSGGGGSGGSGSGGMPATLDASLAGSGGGTSQHEPDEETPPPSCADMGLEDRVVDFQVTHAILQTNIFGITVPPEYTARPQPELPWLTQPACDCYTAEALGHYVLSDDETSLALLASFPFAVPNEPDQPSFAWDNDELLEHVDVIDALYPGRVLAQAAVMPNDRIELQLEMMERLAPSIAAWTVFPEWSPTYGGDGTFLDEGDGPTMIAKAIELGVPIITVHKGKSLWRDMPITYSSPRDIGPAAVRFPEARIVVANAAFEHGLSADQSSAPDPERPDEDLGWGRGVGAWPEGPYEEEDESVMEKYPLARGVNSLIKSLRGAGIGPNGTWLDGADGPQTHVYVTSGTAWPRLMSRPEEAMHFWGKLLLHIGEDRVLWGSVTPEFGSPGTMIQAFRAFEISSELQERYGYPALTPAVKAKILGGNAVRLFTETGRELERCDEP